MDQEHNEAVVMLRHVLQSQPHMFTRTGAATPSGKDLADFCADFIREYSARLIQDRDRSQR